MAGLVEAKASKLVELSEANGTERLTVRTVRDYWLTTYQDTPKLMREIQLENL